MHKIDFKLNTFNETSINFLSHWLMKVEYTQNLDNIYTLILISMTFKITVY